MPRLLTNPATTSGLLYYPEYRVVMAHRKSPDEYVVQSNQRLNDATEGHERLRGRSLSPVFDFEGTKPAPVKRGSSAAAKKAIATGPKKKRRPPKVPWKKPKGESPEAVQQDWMLWCDECLPNSLVQLSHLSIMPSLRITRHAKETPVSLQHFFCV